MGAFLDVLEVGLATVCLKCFLQGRFNKQTVSRSQIKVKTNLVQSRWGSKTHLSIVL